MYLQEVADRARCGESTWKAGVNSVQRIRNVDETGLEIMGCRHSIAQASLNMFYGDIYGYAHYLQKVFLVTRKVKFLWYDIICKFSPWLQKQDQTAAMSINQLSPLCMPRHTVGHARLGHKGNKK